MRLRASLQWVIEQFLNNTSAHIRLLSAIHSFIAFHGKVDLADEASLQKLTEESYFAQPIRGKLHSYTNVFQWQFSVSMQCALPTRSPTIKTTKDDKISIFNEIDYYVLIVNTFKNDFQRRSSWLNKPAMSPMECESRRRRSESQMTKKSMTFDEKSNTTCFSPCITDTVWRSP